MGGLRRAGRRRESWKEREGRCWLLRALESLPFLASALPSRPVAQLGRLSLLVLEVRSDDRWNPFERGLSEEKWKKRGQGQRAGLSLRVHRARWPQAKGARSTGRQRHQEERERERQIA